MNTQLNNQLKSTREIWSRNFVLICLSNFFVFFGYQMTQPTLPLFIKELGGSDRLIGIILGVFTFSALLFRPFVGKALDTHGRSIVYMIGLSMFVISIGLLAFVTSIFFLIFIRFIQGVGWSFSNTATGTIATDIIPPERRGEGLGYFGLSGNLALALGPVIGLMLVNVISFTKFFLICSGFGVVAWILSFFIDYKKTNKDQTKLITFDIFEKSALKPSLLLFFITFIFGGINSFLPLYTIEKGIPGIEFYYIIFAVFLLISRLFAGSIYDKKGHIYVFLPGTILVFSSMLLLSWLPNMQVMLIAAGVYGFGLGIILPALQGWAVEGASKNRKGMANATYFSFFDLGVGVGAIVCGQIAFKLGYGAIYIASSASVLLSIILYLFLLFRTIKST